MTERKIIAPVVVDVGIGRHVEWFDINQAALVAYMRARGFSDEQIESGVIRIASGDNPRAKQFARGTYFAEDDIVQIAPEQDFIEARAQGYDDATVRAEVDDTLAHELEHRAQELLAGNMKDTARKYWRNIVYRDIGATGVAYSGMVGSSCLTAQYLPTTAGATITLGAVLLGWPLAEAAVARLTRHRAISRYDKDPLEVAARQAGQYAPAFVEITLRQPFDSTADES